MLISYNCLIFVPFIQTENQRFMNKSFIQTAVKTSLIWLIFAAFIGALLRYAFIGTMPKSFEYKNFMHAHTHLMFLGWIFNALFIGIIAMFLHDFSKKYYLLFVILQIAVGGMAVTFPLGGYFSASIAFSTAHILLSYVFAVLVWFDVQKHEHTVHDNPSVLALDWALLFMLLSSLGPIAVGYISSAGIRGVWSNLSVYFYLHTQYNGWFTFGILALILRILENKHLIVNKKRMKHGITLLGWSALLTFSLAALWLRLPNGLYFVAWAGIFIQLGALISFWDLFRLVFKTDIFENKWSKYLMIMVAISFISRIILQTASAIPAVTDFATQYKNMLLAYLHLIFIGFVTLFLFAYFIENQWLKIETQLSKRGLITLVVSFLASELFLTIQPTNYTLLFIASAGMAVGFILTCAETLKLKT